RTFSLALIYGKLTSGMHPDIASHRSVLYGFKRPIDLMETKFQQEDLGTYEESIDRLSKSVQLRQSLETMIKRAEEDMFRLVGGRGLLLGWLIIESFMESNLVGDQEIYQEKIDGLQKRLRMAFPGRKEELLRIRDAMLANIGKYSKEHRDESDKDGYPLLQCRMLDWELIDDGRAELENLLQAGGTSTPAGRSETTGAPQMRPPAQQRAQTSAAPPTVDGSSSSSSSSSAVERFRSRAQLMLKAGKG